MSSRIECSIQTFSDIFQEPFPGISVKKVCDKGFILDPNNDPTSLPSGKSVGLTLMAVTHGNEVAGIEVLIQVANYIRSGLMSLKFPVAFVLGNYKASLRDLRFIERDLNRSFSCTGDDLWEEKRAKEIEPLLAQTSYLLDIHQTIEPSQKPFFIFPYSEAGFDFAQYLAPEIPIVTHWGDSFSRDGACTDEYVNSLGGVGITIELGQKGFDVYQHGVGTQVAMSAIVTVARILEGNAPVLSRPEATIYTWSDVIMNPSEQAALDEGWHNFKWVDKGQRVGQDGVKSIVSPSSGPILFPKYVRATSGKARPKELCRIMKQISYEQIGQ